MQKNIPYILISFGISIIVCILSFLDIYDNFEHNLLDMRFKSRGLIETRDDIATADIDVRALQTEGKWDPWSREKHIPWSTFRLSMVLMPLSLMYILLRIVRENLSIKS